MCYVQHALFAMKSVWSHSYLKLMTFIFLFSVKTRRGVYPLSLITLLLLWGWRSTARHNCHTCGIDVSRVHKYFKTVREARQTINLFSASLLLPHSIPPHHIRKYTNTQIHKYTNTQTQILKYTIRMRRKCGRNGFFCLL